MPLAMAALRNIRHVLTLVVLAASVAVGPAGAEPFPAIVDYAVLMDDATGAILFDKNGEQLTPPASMSKLMTLAVVFRALKDGQVKFDDEFTVSSYAYETGGDRSGTSSMLLPQGSKVKLVDLLQGIIVQSGNDACIVVAEGISGSEEAFAGLMMEEARRIGLTDSVFVNSTGLPHPNHVMSARDIARLSHHLIGEYPEYYKSFAQRNYTYNNKLFVNRNPLLGMNIAADGLKTGFTEASGYGLAGSAIIGGRRSIVVINGAKSQEQRASEARKLLEWGFRNYKDAEIFPADEIVGEARVWGGTLYYVPLVGDGPVRIMVPRATAQGRLKANVVYKGPLKPPIKKGDRVAVLRVENSEGAISEVPLLAGVDVDRAGVFARGLDSLLLLGLGWMM